MAKLTHSSLKNTLIDYDENVLLFESTCYFDHKSLSYANMISPFFAYAGMALAIVENPYEYSTACPAPKKFASRSSRWT